VNRHWLAGAAAILLIGADCADAADVAIPAAAPQPLYNWSGFYLGVNAGAAFGNYRLDTSTSPNTYLSNPADVAAVNAAGALGTKPTGFAGGGQAGYNWQSGHWVVGVEADLDFLHLNGTASSGAVRYPVGPGAFVTAMPVPNVNISQPVNQFVITDYANADWLATLRARVGYAQNNWLFYVTGGLALTQLRQDFLYTDGVANFAVGAELGARTDGVWKAGSVVGLGVEAGITNNLSFKAEYLHVDFSNTNSPQTLNNLSTFAPGRNQVFTSSGDLTADMVRLGLNYRFGGAAPAWSPGPVMPLKAPVLASWPPVASAWEFEVGTRAWFSSGSVGAPQPLLGKPPPPADLDSRLVYSGLGAITGEVFGRVEHTSGIFVKGFLGAGGIDRGALFDEDFPAGGAYSNTLSGNASGHIGYATIDLGYDFLRTPGARVGAFVGYNYYTQEINTYGCNQLAGASGCAPGAVLPTILGISEDDSFNSLRVGLSSQVMLTDRLKLTTDVAYLPLVSFNGLNHHNARELLLPEAANAGDGVMLETILGYQINEAWNVGAGARYWAWNTNTGTVMFDNLGLGGPLPPVQLARYTTERYGVFLQASYKWGDTTPPLAIAGASLPTKAPPLPVAPINWTGFYLGGHLGGGRSDDRWTDPFGPTPGTKGTNFAGFGDTTNATGPLGGGQVGANLQAGPLVLGVQADISAAHLRGENTCFSGLGGINCQRNINSIDTVTGRVGFAWNRSLAYVKGGAAQTNDTFTLDGNTNGALALGTGVTKLNTQGWTAGGGVEYTVADHWTAFAEYDHIGLPGTTVPFPTVATINAQTIGVKQTVDLFKLGVNYEFSLALPSTTGPRG